MGAGAVGVFEFLWGDASAGPSGQHCGSCMLIGRCGSHKDSAVLANARCKWGPFVRIALESQASRPNQTAGSNCHLIILNHNPIGEVSK